MATASGKNSVVMRPTGNRGGATEGPTAARAPFLANPLPGSSATDTVGQPPKKLRAVGNNEH